MWPARDGTQESSKGLEVPSQETKRANMGQKVKRVAKVYAKTHLKTLVRTREDIMRTEKEPIRVL